VALKKKRKINVEIIASKGKGGNIRFCPQHTLLGELESQAELLKKKTQCNRLSC
jgi:hypothetical protein